MVEADETGGWLLTEFIDFNEEIDRRQVASLKFDGATLEAIFGERDLWPAWVADMDFKASEAIQSAMAKRLEHGIFGYEASNEAIPTAVSNWYQQRHGWAPSPQHFLFTPRTLASIALLIKQFSSEGDGVIVQPPVFYDFKLIINANRRQLVKNPLVYEDGVYRMDFDHLESLAAEQSNRLLILCSPHNPIGRVWSHQDLARVADICARHYVFVIADEIHGDITYDLPYTPFASVSDAAAANSASCLSPVKSFNLAGVTNSMIVMADDHRRAACKDWLNAAEINKNNVFATAAMLAAYSHSGLWLDRVIDYLRGNIGLLRDCCQELLPGIELVEPQGTYLLWLDCRGLKLSVDELQDFLVQKAGIAGNPGHWFGREGAGFVRVNIACPRSVLQRALDQLQSAVEHLSG